MQPRNYFQEAQAIAKRAHLSIIPLLNSAGEVRSYKVFRQTQPRLTFLGNPSDPKKLYDLVRKCARVEG